MGDKELRKGEGGIYDSPLEDYPGYIRFPDPLDGRHYRAWLRETRRDDLEDEIDNLTAFGEWRGALALIEEWSLENLARGDIDETGDNVPTMVQVFVRTAAALYLAENFDLGNWPDLPATM